MKIGARTNCGVSKKIFLTKLDSTKTKPYGLIGPKVNMANIITSPNCGAIRAEMGTSAVGSDLLKR